MNKLHAIMIGLAVSTIALAWGCQENKPTTPNTTSGGQTAAPAPTPARETPPAQNAPAEKPKTIVAQAPAKTTPQPQPAHQTPQPVARTSPPPPAESMAPEQPQEADPRLMAEDLIYAQIRIKMEDMIASRAAMLKSGKNPADVEVRQLEGSIMRARDLLMETGERVEDVNPPIVSGK